MPTTFTEAEKDLLKKMGFTQEQIDIKEYQQQLLDEESADAKKAEAKVLNAVTALFAKCPDVQVRKEFGEHMLTFLSMLLATARRDSSALNDVASVEGLVLTAARAPQAAGLMPGSNANAPAQAHVPASTPMSTTSVVDSIVKDLAITFGFEDDEEFIRELSAGLTKVVNQNARYNGGALLTLVNAMGLAREGDPMRLDKTGRLEVVRILEQTEAKLRAAVAELKRLRPFKAAFDQASDDELVSRQDAIINAINGTIAPNPLSTAVRQEKERADREKSRADQAVEDLRQANDKFTRANTRADQQKARADAAERMLVDVVAALSQRSDGTLVLNPDRLDASDDNVRAARAQVRIDPNARGTRAQLRAILAQFAPPQQ